MINEYLWLNENNNKPYNVSEELIKLSKKYSLIDSEVKNKKVDMILRKNLKIMMNKKITTWKSDYFYNLSLIICPLMLEFH